MTGRAEAFVWPTFALAGIFALQIRVWEDRAFTSACYEIQIFPEPGMISRGCGVAERFSRQNGADKSGSN